MSIPVQTDWQLHLDRRTGRCVLHRGTGPLPMLGIYSTEQLPDQTVIRMRLGAGHNPDPAELGFEVSQRAGA
jgi:hypothetical protein